MGRGLEVHVASRDGLAGLAAFPTCTCRATVPSPGGSLAQLPGLFLIASSICFLTASRLKEAGSCIGG